ncbi:MAG: hypothetical protein HQK51_21495, partial [Oligoflexia bacterium]|nr:hypothetical protein [Oligoflexia bacterium]
AIRELEKLRIEQILDDGAKNITNIKDTKLYHFSLSQIVRTYLEDEFSFKATDMTLEEIKSNIESLNIVKTDFELKKDLLLMLEGCDFVKFTDMEIEKNLSIELLSKAISFIKKVRPQPQQLETNLSTNKQNQKDDQKEEESVI